MTHSAPASLDRSHYQALVRAALAEDLGDGDVTTEASVAADQRARGVFLVKTRPCVLAGLDVALEVFRQLEPGVAVSQRKFDGDRCAIGDAIAEVHGAARTLLVAERTALNFLQRLSGIATCTRQFVDAAAGRIEVLDTRKTTPLLRVLEKYAVLAGGGTNHRMGLYDAVLIKDNHIRLAGGVKAAVARSAASRPGMPIEIEAQNLEQVVEALDAGVAIVLADNMSTDEIRETVRCAKGRARVEISGNVTLDRIDELATTGADFVSIGALTHSAPAADISFEIEEETKDTKYTKDTKGRIE